MKFDTDVDLPVITSSERVDFKRCQKRWYWKWRRGLVPRVRTFGAMDLGTWVHDALAEWYVPGFKRNGILSEHFERKALADIESSGAPDYAIEKAEELMTLGTEMIKGYESFYSSDKFRVVRAEIPLEFTVNHPDKGFVVAAHKIKPDLVVEDQKWDIWLFEHKTAQTVQTEHLVIDDQARPYGSMTEAALRKAGIIKSRHRFRGIIYNFLRKALPDQRPQNSKGQYLNKDQSVSKKQPPPYFVRKRVEMSREDKRITLYRIRDEILTITEMTLLLRTKEVHPGRLQKTPHKSCPKTCPFFAMCVSEEHGADVRVMERTMFRRENPYLYHAESTEDTASFEIT